MTRSSTPTAQKNRWLNIVMDYVGERCAHIVEHHPYLWRAAWYAVHKFSFLLPHDKSYNALRHFIRVRPTGLFLDVGANDGISILSFRKFDKKYRILALEPNPTLEAPLSKIKATDSLVDYKMVGAGLVTSQIEFFVPIYRGIPLHTFTASDSDQVRTAVARSFGAGVASVTVFRKFEAEIIRIDDLALDPAIVKIDAEGFDYDVLQGMIATTRRSRPFIITEIAVGEFAKIRQHFADLDYELLTYDLFHDWFDLEIAEYRYAVDAMSGHRNFFAAPRELVGSLPLKPRAPVQTLQ